MASSSLSLALLLLLFTAAATISEARDFLVGGNANAWAVPSPSSPTLNQWAESTRFQVGDSLVWKLEGRKDAVLQVSRAGYLSCNASSPITEHREESEVVIKLGHAGPYYFISGENGACEKGEKMTVVVMERGKQEGIMSSLLPVGRPWLWPWPRLLWCQGLRTGRRWLQRAAGPGWWW